MQAPLAPVADGRRPALSGGGGGRGSWNPVQGGGRGDTLGNLTPFKPTFGGGGFGTRPYALRTPPDRMECKATP